MADDFQYVKLPDGSYGKFAANASDADIHAQISRDFPGAMKGESQNLATRIQNSFDSNTATQPTDTPLQALIKGTVHGAGQMFVHPIDTAIATAKTAANVVNPLRIGPPQFVKDAYRSVADAPNKLQAAANLTGNIVGGIAAGKAIEPVGAASLKVAGPAAARVALLGKTPEGAYESALKPSTTLDPAVRADIVSTGLREGIPVSKAGVEQVGDKIDLLNNEIKQQIASDPNRQIDPQAVATRIADTKERFSKQVNAQPDLDAIEDARLQFLKEQGAKPRQAAVSPQPTGLLDSKGQPIMSTGKPAIAAAPAPPMSAADAQAMKQGTYGILKGKFGEQGSATVEAQKSLARGLKEEIANAFPEIGNLNAAESKLLSLKPVLERAVSRISNHQILGIGTPVTGAAVKAATGSSLISGAGMVAKAVLDNPAIKSKIAILVSKGAKIPYADALARVGAYTASAGAISSAQPSSTSGGYASLSGQ